MTPPHRVPHLAQGAWTAHLPGSSPPPRQAYHPSSVPRAQSQRPLAVAATLGSRQRCCRRSASEDGTGWRLPAWTSGPRGVCWPEKDFPRRFPPRLSMSGPGRLRNHPIVRSRSLYHHRTDGTLYPAQLSTQVSGQS